MTPELHEIADRMRRHLKAIETDATFHESPYYDGPPPGKRGWWCWREDKIAEDNAALARAFVVKTAEPKT